MNTSASLFFTTTLLVLGAGAAFADVVTNDDSIVRGSLCVGTDCQNGQAFGYDTFRLAENNLRIRFDDTSASSTFPAQDWQITINDSANGGQSYFGIEDITAQTLPFYIGANTPSHTIHTSASGFVGIGTATPLVELNVKSNNTPTLRLEQDFTGGFTPRSWDLGGNESNFFIRDATNGGLMPFRILPNAGDSSLVIGAGGAIGLNTETPAGPLDLAHPGNLANHAVLVDSSGNVGINIDDTYQPEGIFDVQTTGGVSRLRVESDGSIKLSNSWQVTAANGGSLTLQSTSNAATKIELNDDGSIVIGDGITVDASGNVTVTNLTVTGTCTGC